MADFRIQLPEEPDGIARRELDWDRKSHVWTRSEKEYGAVQWDLGQPATPLDLDHLLRFFRISKPAPEGVLARMSPGECVMTHISQSSSRDIVAALCPDCGEHWLVYRLEDGEIWHLYGRTCKFAWHRGLAVDPKEDALLAALLKGSADS